MRDVAVVAFAQTQCAVNDKLNDAEVLVPLFADVYDQVGWTKEDIGFFCSGSSDFLAGQGFSFVQTIDAVAPVPPVSESHVEMDGAWALYEAWVKIQTGMCDTALIYGYGRSSPGSLRDVLATQLDPTGFRVRQLGWALGAFGIGVLFTAAIRPPAAMAVLLILGGPALAFLLLEQQVADASTRWKRQLYLELPVVAEQLGMLLGAGWSLFGAIDRVAVRGEGAVSADLGRVVGRIRQGRSEADALREWSQLADVPAVDRLVSVLSLDRETTDLAGLIAEEARAIRKDVHRELIETMGKRSQKVWIPVTVATLLPGVIFIAIPFIKAVELFAG